MPFLLLIALWVSSSAIGSGRNCGGNIERSSTELKAASEIQYNVFDWDHNDNSVLVAVIRDLGKEFEIIRFAEDQKTVLSRSRVPRLRVGTTLLYPVADTLKQVDQAAIALGNERAIQRSLAVNRIDADTYHKKRKEIRSRRADATSFDLDCLTIAYLVVHAADRVAVARHGMEKAGMSKEDVRLGLFNEPHGTWATDLDVRFTELMENLKMLRQHGYAAEAKAAADAIFAELEK